MHTWYVLSPLYQQLYLFLSKNNMIISTLCLIAIFDFYRLKFKLKNQHEHLHEHLHECLHEYLYLATRKDCIIFSRISSQAVRSIRTINNKTYSY